MKFLPFYGGRQNYTNENYSQIQKKKKSMKISD